MHGFYYKFQASLSATVSYCVTIVNHSRSPEIDSQPCGIPGLRKRLQIRALINHSPFHRCGVILFLRISFLYTYFTNQSTNLYYWCESWWKRLPNCVKNSEKHIYCKKKLLLVSLYCLFYGGEGGRWEGGRGRDLDNWDKWETGLCCSYLFCAYCMMREEDKRTICRIFYCFYS